jgi:putative ATP-dependent endonuclease of OLD family
LPSNKIDLEKNGIEIVNIGGVAFEHFGKLYNNSSEGKSLSSKCSIITDSDPQTDKPVSDRALNANKLTGHNLYVFLAPHTFEYDLFETSDNNKKVMREVYRNIHNKTEELKGNFNVETLMNKLNTNRDKAEFALQLHDKLLSTEEFNVPEYIQKAIEFVMPQIISNV